MGKRLALLAGAFLVAIAFAWWATLGRTRPETTPPASPEEFSALRGSAERVANLVLPESSLTEQKVELTVPQGQIDREATRVKLLAADFGGSAVGSPAEDGGTDLLVQLPAERSAAFLEAVKGARATGEAMPAAGTTEKVFVEVVLRNLPAPTR